MIITRIMGGLGNQMFQYAIAKSIAKKNNDEFKLDLSFYPNQGLRQYELNQFCIEEGIATEDECAKLRGSDGLFYKAIRKLNFKWQRPESYFFEYELHTAKFQQYVFDYDGSMYLDGYWQNEEYFKNIRNEILQKFTLRNGINRVTEEYLREIEKSCSVSLHVRRGDYLHAKNIGQNICDLDFYKRAVLRMQGSIGKDCVFYIFSDDISWCQDNFHFLNNKIFIMSTGSPVYDLELMKNCKHNIIANSTFSWWGAWLNDSPNKVVIAPRVWWLNKPIKTLALDSWIQI